MAKQAVSIARLAVVAAAMLCLLLAMAPQEAAGAEGQYLSYDKVLSCKVLGNCEKNQGPEATRPGKPANEYTRGCSAITRCRG